MTSVMTPLAAGSDAVLLVVRLVMGVTMIYYGWPKVKDLQKNAQDFVEMGFKPGWLWGTPVALLEFFGGIGIMAGILVPVWAAGMCIHMASGAVWKITKTDKKFSDWSYDLLLLSLALLLLTVGPGTLRLL